MKIAVLGAGAWGTALAAHATSQHSVSLWSRNQAVVDDIDRNRRNGRYLPDVELAPIHERH